MHIPTIRFPKLTVCLLLAAFCGPHAAWAQRGTENGEWRNYGGNKYSSKYTPLAQIDATNFGSLQEAWRWTSADDFISMTVSGGEWRAKSSVVFDRLNDLKPDRWRGGMAPRLGSLKVTPLMVDGVIYVVTPIYQAAAIDAATGETLWVYNPKSYETGTPTMSLQWNHRGPAYWTDGTEARILWGTGDAYLISVDAKTGRPDAGFGDNGRVDLTVGMPRANRADRDYLNAMTYSSSSPPLIAKDVVVMGSLIADRRITKESIPGDVRGFDVRTGELIWTFHTVPREGEFGVETWKNDSWKYSGNCNVWSMMSVDEELGYVYLPTGTATNDYYGVHRPGDNLFAESLICVDMQTGKRIWHFQTVHHGLWDYDNPAAPNLVDIVVDGKPIKAVAQITKQGFCYVFDRVTGEPVWPIEERAVPPATMPGEIASPTQPHPTKPPAFEYQGVTIDDLVDFTPEIRQIAVGIVKNFKIGPLFTPPSLPIEGGTQGTIQRPSLGGGANWSGAGVDPETGILYVPSRNSMSVLTYYDPGQQYGEAGTLDLTHGTPRGRRRGASSRMPDGLPLFKPPYSRLTAIDLNRGEHAWMAPLGNGDRYRDNPKLEDLNLPPLGGDGYTGPLVTKTLVIIGQSAGGRGASSGKLVARDKATGRIVGEVTLPGRPIGAPMSYMHDGKQYIAVTVNASPPKLVALRLPS